MYNHAFTTAEAARQLPFVKMLSLKLLEATALWRTHVALDIECLVNALHSDTHKSTYSSFFSQPASIFVQLYKLSPVSLQRCAQQQLHITYTDWSTTLPVVLYHWNNFLCQLITATYFFFFITIFNFHFDTWNLRIVMMCLKFYKGVKVNSQNIQTGWKEAQADWWGCRAGQALRRGSKCCLCPLGRVPDPCPGWKGSSLSPEWVPLTFTSVVLFCAKAGSAEPACLFVCGRERRAMTRLL